MFWPTKATFKENLVKNKCIYDKTVVKDVHNLQYHAIKYC
jgi:hypothetical protein